MPSSSATSPTGEGPFASRQLQAAITDLTNAAAEVTVTLRDVLEDQIYEIVSLVDSFVYRVEQFLYRDDDTVLGQVFDVPAVLTQEIVVEHEGAVPVIPEEEEAVEDARRSEEGQEEDEGEYKYCMLCMDVLHHESGSGFIPACPVCRSVATHMDA